MSTTLVFTDVVDSTLLVERLGDQQAAQFWDEHDRHARELLARHGGREIERTDGFFLLFDSAVSAARFAREYHRVLGEHGRQARIGVHVGPVTLRANAPKDVGRGAKPVEVEGLAKPVAARIMALARPGQTLLSASAHGALAAGELPAGCATLSHGHYRLKGLEHPLEMFELAEHASSFLAPGDAEKAYRVVRVGELWRPVRDVPHNLPAERDTFIGRGAELRALARRLDDGARLVTLLGPAGIGKTRLACRYGLAMLGEWPGGAYFCDLSDARSLDGVHFAVARALGVPLAGGDPTIQLGHALAARKRCLVILDNFEQVLDHAPATLERWLERAADAAFVVTSRERLRLPGESLLLLEPLPLVDDAVALFVARARAQRPDFSLDAANRTAVDEVVRLLDGLPLAIELAAARVRLFSPVQLVQRMKDRFSLLAGARGGVARQSALRVAIDWSWELLAPVEQAALAQCSVFEGGFMLAAAEAVLALDAWPEAPPVLDLVHSLVDKSLLRSWIPPERGHGDRDEPRFGMYFSIHEYADTKLGADGTPERMAALQRHGRYYARFGTDEVLDAVAMRGGAVRLADLVLDLDNHVAACRRATQRSDPDCAVRNYRACCEAIDMRGPFSVAVELGARVLALDPMQPALRAAACYSWGQALARVGRSDDAEATLDEALALARELGAARLQARCLSALGTIARERGSPQRARANFESALALVRASGSRLAEGRLLAHLALVDPHLNGGETSVRHFEESLAAHREVGNRRDEGIALANLGILRANFGYHDEALRLLREALAIHREVEDLRSEGNGLANIGLVLHEIGRDAEALPYYEQALDVSRRVGGRFNEGFVLHALGNLHHVLGHFAQGRADLEAAIAIYREMGARQGAGEALGHLAELHFDERRHEQARAAFAEGERLLREVGDPLTLTVLLCARGAMQLALGERERTREVLTEAEALAERAGGGTDSVAWRAVRTLRDALGQVSAPGEAGR